MRLEKGFVADRDMVDSLKMELSGITPRLADVLRQKAIAIQAEVVNQYGEFIPPSTLHKTKGIEDRIIVCSGNGFQLFDQAWTSTRVKEPMRIRGKIYRNGYLMVFDDPLHTWEFIDEEAREREIRRGTRAGYTQEQVKIALCRIYLHRSLGHEIIHQYQDWSLHSGFLEPAVEYYVSEILERLGLNYFDQGEIQDAMASTYQFLIDRFGNDIHRIFFGSCKPQRKAAIFEEIDNIVAGAQR